MIPLVLLGVAPFMYYWCYKALDSTRLNGATGSPVAALDSAWLYGATGLSVAALGSVRLYGAISVES